jgi:hypothetical protein
MEPDDLDAPSVAVHWPPAPASEIDRPIWLALVVALVLLVTTGTRPGGETIAALVAVGAILAVAVRWSVPVLGIGILVIVGVGLRASLEIHWGSDVMDVVASAIRHVAIGDNPYGVGYTASRPPGAPYAYGPLPLLWYAPLQEDGWELELIMACLVLTLLAIRGKLLGLAFYAVGPTLVATSGDGSNDTSAGVLLLLALVVAERRPRLGAVLLAVAVAFKPYAAAWAPAFFVWGGWSVFAIFVASSVVLWSPVLFIWGIGSFLRSLDLADKIHGVTYWSLGELFESVFHRGAPRDLFNQFRIVLGTVTAAATLRWARSIDGVILAGTLVYLVTLYAGFWSTYAYFGAIAPILCWKVDGWLGIPQRPIVRLPGDPPRPTAPRGDAGRSSAALVDRNAPAT